MKTQHTKTQASANAVQIIGAETGHTVQNIAFCDSAERAAFIVKAVNCYDELTDCLGALLEIFVDKESNHPWAVKARAIQAKAKGAA